MRELVTYGPGLLLWAAVAYRFPILRRSTRDERARALWLTSLALAMSLTLMWPGVYAALDRLAGVPNLARLLANMLVLVAGWFNQCFFFHLNYSQVAAAQRARRSARLLAAALVVMASLFLLAGVDEERWNFTDRYASAPFIVEYRLVYLAYLALTIAVVMRLAWQYAQVAVDPSVKVGLRLVAAAGLVGLGYVANEALSATTRRFGLVSPAWNTAAVTDGLGALSVLLLVIGSTLPAWGHRAGIPALHRWATHYRAYRRLYPLWVTVYRVNPGIALLPPTSAIADVLAVRNLEFRLYRRVVEIWDGRLALRPYLDPGVLEHAWQASRRAGLSDSAAQVLVEAVSLAAALRARQQGRPPRDVSMPPPSSGTDVDSDADFLGQVAHCLGHSPLVATILAEVQPELPDATSALVASVSRQV